MRVLVSGSSGHLGEALMRTLPAAGHQPVGLDIKPSAFTHKVGSIADRDVVRDSLTGIDAILHTATLHKPHVATHSRQAFVETNVTGTLNLLEEAVAAGIGTFVFTSTTSVLGRALTPPPGLRKTSCRCQGTSTASPSWLPKTCASCSITGSAWRASC